jgi:hypothetical protein
VASVAVEGVRTLTDGLALVAAVNTLVGGSTGETLGLALGFAGAAVPQWVTALFGAHAILHIETFIAFAPCRAICCCSRQPTSQNGNLTLKQRCHVRSHQGFSIHGLPCTLLDRFLDARPATGAHHSQPRHL